MRITAADVAKVVEVDPSINMDIFIATAEAVVDSVCVPSFEGYTLANLTLVEQWLAAHFYLIRDTQAQTEKADEVSVTYSLKPGFNLALTSQGQQAMFLDKAFGKGALSAANKAAELGNGGTASGVWVGGDSSKQSVGVYGMH